MEQSIVEKDLVSPVQENEGENAEQKKEPTVGDLVAAEAEELRDQGLALDGGYDMILKVLEFLQSEPFFSAISRRLTKIATKHVPTMAVGLAGQELALMYNVPFAKRLSDMEMWIVLKHEFYHILLLHLGKRIKPRRVLWNIAADLALNSLIDGQSTSIGGSVQSVRVPDWMLVPGRRPLPPPWAEVKAEEKQGNELADLIEKFPPKMAAEWYYQSLLEAAQNSGSKDGEGDTKWAGDFAPWDDHRMWGEDDELLEEKIRQALRAAVDEAERHNKWGSIPEELRAELRRMLSREVDWRALLRRFVGRSQTLKKNSTIKRINRKYPYVHPGFSRQRSARVAVAIDQSGSMSDDDIALLFGELESMARHTTFIVVPFDASVAEDCVFTWKKGQRVVTKRVRCGGTDFEAPTKWANEHLGEIDGLIVLTDGAAPKPNRCKVRRAWVTIPKCSLMFETDELIIQMKRVNQSD